MIKLKITVTKEILEKSKWCGYKLDNEEFKLTSQNCAIALAVRDVFPNAGVGANSVLLDPPSEYFTNLPQEAIDFITAFDKSDPGVRSRMTPISFEIEIPDSVIGKINIEELRPLLVNHPTLQLI
jgi:hypothetical protein